MPSITFTVTNAEAARIISAATALGYPDAKTMIVAQVTAVVASHEAGVYQGAYLPAPSIAPV